ncbi:MAG TPA: dimethylsulfonioproprionate lyase family protein [Candidatus Tectomicrobia bacterium]|nr:dimethylsulfonioproprionate lyase family protein [Candidatus Tectomicrobia bacterium]
MDQASDWKTPKFGTGVSAKVLRRDDQTGGMTFLFRFEPGGRFPAHRHPAGEEAFVVEGRVRIGNRTFGPGEYVYTPPGGVHAASSEEGGTILVVLPKPVEILAD